MKYLAFLTIVVFVFASQSCYYDNEEDLYQFFNSGACNTTNVTYSTEVVATLQQYCYSCHNAQTAATLGAGIDVSTYQQAKVYVDDGSLYGSIIHAAGFSPMPEGTGKIPQCDQDIIKAWIDAGAPNN